MNQSNLRQLKNNVEIIGTLKSKELEVKDSAAGKTFISGKLVVQTITDEKVNEHVIKIFVMESSKLYKGIEKVKNEYKTINQDGIKNADRIKVKGTLKLNEYFGAQENLIQYNEVRGMYFQRLETNNEEQDYALASIETVIEGFSEKVDEEQLPKGQFAVKGFTVGWNDEVIELKDTFIDADLSQAFINLYEPGSTGRLSFKLASYAEDVEKQQQSIATGFGKNVEIKDIFEPTKKYVSNIRIVGGDVPYVDSKKYTLKEIEIAKQIRINKIEELKIKNNISISQQNNGFGQGAPVQNVESESKPFIDPNGMPDF
ncbi:hypothetical protein ACIQXQ_09405 [Peribacillus sp. NPDC097198]|uniref:hypothetical protein n=1 Tax=Peribacillus sp. NPDC097198 TaxID=3364397 RepID=UPI0038218441